MKTKICLALALLLVVTIPICTASDPMPEPAKPQIQDYERIGIGESIEKVVELKDDHLAIVSFTIEKGEKVKLRYEVEVMEEEYEQSRVGWAILSEEVYEAMMAGRDYDEEDFTDFGEGSFIHKTLFLDESGTYYFTVAISDEQLTISYKIELEDVTPTPAPSPAPTPGFEAVLAIAGLLAVVYLLRKRE